MSNPLITNNDVRPISVGEFQVAEDVTVAQDASVIPAGAVLGVITSGAAANAVAGTNTGNGTVSASPTKLAGVKPGIYTILFTAATQFDLIDPLGQALAPGRTGVAYASQLGFTITAGGTPFVAGDSFTITVAAGSRQVRRSVSTATDGSQFPKYVTSQEINAIAGARTGVQLLKKAKVRRDGLVFTGSETFETVVPTTGKTLGELLEDSGIVAIPGETIGRYDNQ